LIINLKKDTNNYFSFSVLVAFFIVASMVFGATQGFAATGNYANGATDKISSHIYFDKRVYNIGQKATVILLDKNLDRRHDAIDTYRPASGFISLKIAGKTMPDSFTQKVFQSSFIETGTHTGIFKAKLKIPATDDTGKSIKGKDIRITYIDIHNQMRWHDTVTVL